MTDGEIVQIFKRERRKFSRYFPHVARAGLSLQAKPASAARRDQAWTDGRRAVLYHTIRNLPRHNIVGVIRHELAHLSDMSLNERAADTLAEAVTGKPIRYDRNKIQTIGKGGPRPKHLRNPCC